VLLSAGDGLAYAQAKAARLESAAPGMLAAVCLTKQIVVDVGEVGSWPLIDVVGQEGEAEKAAEWWEDVLMAFRKGSGRLRIEIYRQVRTVGDLSDPFEGGVGGVGFE